MDKLPLRLAALLPVTWTAAAAAAESPEPRRPVHT